MAEFSTDQKGQASLILGELIGRTRENFPDSRFRPQVLQDTEQYHLYGITPSPYGIWVTADGIGTKPELAERLYSETGDPTHFENLAFDAVAMVESDEARFGRILLGIANIIDINTADPVVISALARGLLSASNAGKFAVLNGETAELGYQTSGWGNIRVNWNMVGVSLVVPDKLILGQSLEPGQPIVAFREDSIRSNGLIQAKAILEAAYLHNFGYPSKRSWIIEQIASQLVTNGLPYHELLQALQKQSFPDSLSQIQGHDFMEQVLLPWHRQFPDLAQELLKSSILYEPVINEAQGWVDGPKQVNITAAAHISGGGVPEKVRRMVSPKRLGAHIDTIFPDPTGVQMLMELANTLPEAQRNQLISERIASQQWNRGIGFLVATRTVDDAKTMVEIASQQGYEAAIAGTILEDPKIEWRGETWTY